MNDYDKPTTIGFWVKLTIAALAVRVAVAFFLFGDLPQKSDPLAYADQARTMVATSESGGLQGYFWPPGRSFCLVPFFLMFGTSEEVVKANSVALDLACVLLAALLAHQTLRRRSAARLAGWIAAFYPPAVMLSGWSYSMNAVMVFLMSSSCLALAACRASEKRQLQSLGIWFLSGCLLGLAILTRPSAVSVLFLAVLGGIGFLAIRWIRPSVVGAAARLSFAIVLLVGAVFLLGVACAIGPIVHRHVSLGKGWVVSTNCEATLFYGNNPYTPHYKTWHLGQHQSDTPEYNAYLSSFTSTPDSRSAMTHEALRYIAERPDIFVLRTASRIRAFWGFDYIASARIKADCHAYGWLGPLACLITEAGGYCLVMVLVICGLFLFPKAMETRHALFLIALAAAYQLPYTIVFASGVYHFPVMGFLFPFAGLALDEARFGTAAFWQTIKSIRWFWIAVGVFILVQVEYAYHVFVYSSV